MSVYMFEIETSYDVKVAEPFTIRYRVVGGPDWSVVRYADKDTANLALERLASIGISGPEGAAFN